MVVCPPAPASCNAAACAFTLCPQPGFGPILVPALPFGSDPSAGHHRQHHGPGGCVTNPRLGRDEQQLTKKAKFFGLRAKAVGRCLLAQAGQVQKPPAALAAPRHFAQTHLQPAACPARHPQGELRLPRTKPAVVQRVYFFSSPFLPGKKKNKKCTLLPVYIHSPAIASRLSKQPRG